MCNLFSKPSHTQGVPHQSRNTFFTSLEDSGLMSNVRLVRKRTKNMKRGKLLQSSHPQARIFDHVQWCTPFCFQARKVSSVFLEPPTSRNLTMACWGSRVMILSINSADKRCKSSASPTTPPVLHRFFDQFTVMKFPWTWTTQNLPPSHSAWKSRISYNSKLKMITACG